MTGPSTLGTAPAGAPALEVDGLTVGYTGAPVLEGLALTMRPGEIVALLGANGAGKTTLLRTLSGLVPPRAGTVLLDGHDLAAVSVEGRARRGLAQVPEGRSVVTELTV
jgi:branched-chain amino acid transport system ATP-binding protein